MKKQKRRSTTVYQIRGCAGEGCAVRFKPKRGNHIYHDQLCRPGRRRARDARECGFCGQGFTPRTAGQVYHGARCLVPRQGAGT